MNFYFVRRVVTAAALSILLVVPSSESQDLEPRFGFGFTGMVSTADGLGLGFRARASAPVSPDLSFAVDLGTTGFFLSGIDSSTWIFDPQVSAIVTLSGITKAPYLLAGIGGYIPVNDGSNSPGGPTVHAGFGYVRQLNQSSLFYEVNPALLLEQSKVELIIPFRVGVIF